MANLDPLPIRHFVVRWQPELQSNQDIIVAVFTPDSSSNREFLSLVILRERLDNNEWGEWVMPQHPEGIIQLLVVALYRIATGLSSAAHITPELDGTFRDLFQQHMVYREYMKLSNCLDEASEDRRLALTFATKEPISAKDVIYTADEERIKSLSTVDFAEELSRVSIYDPDVCNAYLNEARLRFLGLLKSATPEPPHPMESPLNLCVCSKCTCTQIVTLKGSVCPYCAAGEHQL